MKVPRLPFFVCILAACLVSGVCSAQTVRPAVTDKYSASTVREVYAIVRHIEAGEELQKAIADKIEEENALYAKALKEGQGILTDDAERALKKFHKGWFTALLSKDQQAMYWRGIYSNECNREGNRIANEIADRNPNFNSTSRKTAASTLRQIFLEYKVIENMYVKPKKIKELKDQAWDKWTDILAEKIGWRLARDYSVTDIWGTDRILPKMD